MSNSNFHIGIGLLFIAILFTSCERDLNLDIDFESKLVINSTFSPGEQWLVHVSKTGNILDDEERIENIPNADVFIRNKETNQEFDLNYVGNGNYMSLEDVPSEGIDYELVVSAEGFDEVCSSNKISPNPIIADLDTTELFLPDGQKALKIVFDILDESSEENYYIWDLVIEISDPSDISGESVSIQGILETEDSNVDDVSNPDDRTGHGRIFLSDDAFNGTRYNTSFINIVDETNYVKDGNEQNGGSGSNGGGQLSDDAEYTYKLRVLSVSKDLYEYYKSIDIYKWNSDVNSNLSQPTQIYSNIKNGYGIFGAYNQQIIEI